MEPTRKEEKKEGDQVTMETKRTESEMGQMNYNWQELERMAPHQVRSWPIHLGAKGLTEYDSQTGKMNANMMTCVLNHLTHSPVWISQLYPCGQQCVPSLQQTAFGTEQQPH
ncbi:hypothetical protein OS493_038148 [Desmophyllum pertusum]|uniref:Uncharacterized protein n=1 Tax=Desmophyllum pertusum TaxID=174260 RepID=A0A9W9Z633_9CNID|nr:hypothetical protein OS493_038148 [Desmophyllum pertusum]